MKGCSLISKKGGINEKDANIIEGNNHGKVKMGLKLFDSQWSKLVFLRLCNICSTKNIIRLEIRAAFIFQGQSGLCYKEI